MLLILFGILLLGALIGLHLYVWRRLVRDPFPGVSTRRWATAVFAVGPACVVAMIALRIVDAPFVLHQVTAWPGYLWMAAFLYLLLTFLALDAVRFVARGVRRVRARRRPSSGPPGPRVAPPSSGIAAVASSSETATVVTRRQFVARAVATTAVAVSATTVASGTYGVLRGPRVAHVTVPLARLPRVADGMRIAVVSDIHLGPTLGRGFAQKVVDTVNSTEADLIAVVGDLVDGDVDDLASAAAPLARLRARHGAFFVTGNHEYISGVDQWVEHLQELGLQPLQNARVELPWIDLAGVNDEMGDRYEQAPDYDLALGDRDPSRPVVLMAHQPVQVHEARRHGVDLQLSGHTHGGQFWPGPWVAGLVNPTVAGLEAYGDTQLFVTRGAGAWGPPTRVGAPSDVTVVELRSPDA